MHTSLRNSLLAFLFAIASFASSLAQTSVPPAKPTITVTARLVLLDVVVTDAAGAVVPGLTKDDFQIIEDGKPRPIRNFEAWTPTNQPSSTTSAPQREVPQTIFVLDELNTPFEEKSYAAFTLKKYLQRQPAALASPTMLLLVNDGGLHSLTSYTTDRDALIHALDKRPAAVPGQLTQGQNFELLAESFAVLRQIALSSQGSHAHKNLVWLGRGFPSLDTTNLQAPEDAALKDAIRSTTTLLTDTRITLYKVDPITQQALAIPADLNTAIDVAGSVEGNANLSPLVEDPSASNFNFNAFAVATGGSYFYGRNDLDAQIADSLKRGSEFYTLSYVPNGTPGAYHTIRIKLRNPALHATTRQGYYDAVQPADLSAEKRIPVDLDLAATSRMTYDGVSVQLANTATPIPGKSTVAFTLADHSLTWIPNDTGSGYTTRIRIMVVALNADRKIQHSTISLLGLAARNAAETAQGVLRANESVATDANTRFVRLIVEDASGRIGTAETNLMPQK